MNMLIRFFAWLLAQTTFQDVISIREQDNYLIIKPHYHPLVILFTARVVAALIAIGVILTVFPILINRDVIDDDTVAVILIILLCIVCLWKMYSSTRTTLKTVVIPKTVFDRLQKIIRVSEIGLSLDITKR